MRCMNFRSIVRYSHGIVWADRKRHAREPNDRQKCCRAISGWDAVQPRMDLARRSRNRFGVRRPVGALRRRLVASNGRRRRLLATSRQSRKAVTSHRTPNSCRKRSNFHYCSTDGHGFLPGRARLRRALIQPDCIPFTEEGVFGVRMAHAFLALRFGRRESRGGIGARRSLAIQAVDAKPELAGLFLWVFFVCFVIPTTLSGIMGSFASLACFARHPPRLPL
jgi:hypothetical protein